MALTIAYSAKENGALRITAEESCLLFLRVIGFPLFILLILSYLFDALFQQLRARWSLNVFSLARTLVRPVAFLEALLTLSIDAALFVAKREDEPDDDRAAQGAPWGESRDFCTLASSTNLMHPPLD